MFSCPVALKRWSNAPCLQVGCGPGFIETSAVPPLYAGLIASFGRKLDFVTDKLWSNPCASTRSLPERTEYFELIVDLIRVPFGIPERDEDRDPSRAQNLIWLGNRANCTSCTRRLNRHLAVAAGTLISSVRPPPQPPDALAKPVWSQDRGSTQSLNA
jgi:hypothetical protein